jgi:hypothetical protein
MKLGEEPNIVINGVTLSTAEAMTVRVALGCFAITLDEEEFGNDQQSGSISQGYKQCISNIHRIMHVRGHCRLPVILDMGVKYVILLLFEHPQGCFFI